MGAGKQCEACRNVVNGTVQSKGLNLCTSCNVVAGRVRLHAESIRYLFLKIHDENLPEPKEDKQGERIKELCEIIEQQKGRLEEIMRACGFKEYVHKDIVETVRAAAAKQQPAAQAVCNKDECDELRNAISLLLAVHDALGTYAPDDGKPESLPASVGKIRLLLAEASAMKENSHPNQAGPDDSFVVPQGYEKLFNVFANAMHQAAKGKGRERHATDEPFERQQMCRITRAVGLGYPIGQATKKAEESMRLGKAGPFEILGAINFLAGAFIVMVEQTAGE
jgi:hypothetical protein